MTGWEGLRTLSAAVVLVLLLYVAVGLTRIQEQVDLRLEALQGVAQALVSGLQGRVSVLEAEVQLLRNFSPPSPPPPPWKMPQPCSPPPLPPPLSPPRSPPPPPPPPVLVQGTVWVVRVVGFCLFLAGAALCRQIYRTWSDAAEEGEEEDVEAPPPVESPVRPCTCRVHALCHARAVHTPLPPVAPPDGIKEDVGRTYTPQTAAVAPSPPRSPRARQTGRRRPRSL